MVRDLRSTPAPDPLPRWRRYLFVALSNEFHLALTEINQGMDTFTTKLQQAAVYPSRSEVPDTTPDNLELVEPWNDLRQIEEYISEVWEKLLVVGLTRSIKWTADCVVLMGEGYKEVLKRYNLLEEMVGEEGGVK